MSDTTDSTMVPGADGCDQFVDDGRDEILLMHKGTEREAVSTMGVKLTVPEYTTKPVSKLVLQMVKDFFSLKVIKRTRMARHCRVVIDELITDVLKMKEMVTKGELLFPVINVNGCKMCTVAVLVLVCSLLNAATSASCRRAWRIPRTTRRTKISNTPTTNSIELIWRAWEAWKSVSFPCDPIQTNTLPAITPSTNFPAQ